jgi:hypothetical protein
VAAVRAAVVVSSSLEVPAVGHAASAAASASSAAHNTRARAAAVAVVSRLQTKTKQD